MAARRKRESIVYIHNYILLLECGYESEEEEQEEEAGME